jgi:hypothetical protein
LINLEAEITLEKYWNYKNSSKKINKNGLQGIDVSNSAEGII